MCCLFPVPPTISGDPEEEYITIENDTIILPCEVSGSPTPVVYWKKNFVELIPNPDRYLMSEQGLTINSAQLDDKAIYECVAENDAGFASKAIALVVQSKRFSFQSAL